jgi:hypothetical protein
MTQYPESEAKNAKCNKFSLSISIEVNDADAARRKEGESTEVPPYSGCTGVK